MVMFVFYVYSVYLFLLMMRRAFSDLYMSGVFRDKCRVFSDLFVGTSQVSRRHSPTIPQLAFFLVGITCTISEST